MAGELMDALASAEAEVARLKREIAQGPCVEFGHDWQSIGGKNAACDDNCQCSVPVHVCARCGDCDYGENEAADDARRECAALTGGRDDG